jgi:hypothetical protein
VIYKEKKFVLVCGSAGWKSKIVASASACLLARALFYFMHGGEAREQEST